MNVRKWLLALTGLLVSAIAQAHRLGAVPFSSIGSLDDTTHQAAYLQGHTYLPSIRTQVAFNTYGGVCDGVADDTLAFRAFKAANQGTAPIQLNLPTGTCTWTPGSGSNQFLFKGVQDLIVQGQGQANTSIKNLGSVAYMFFGGDGQKQNNANSIRTADANEGDSCVTLKTSPFVTVSNASNNLTVPATFTASISATTMTVTAVASGTIAPGAYVTNRRSNVTPFTQIQPYGTRGTTGVGGTGTYAITISQSRGSGTFTTAPASFTADFGVSTANTLTVSAVADGTITPGMFVYSNGGGIGAPMVIQPYGTGGTTGGGGTGTYNLNVGPASGSVSSRGFIGNGQIRLTLNSTDGLSTGDTLPFFGITGGGLVPLNTSGLQWIKVINGTQVDLFQKDFNGGYTSGGTGGGDQTALFPVGSKVLMSGWANQAYYGKAYSFPSNPHFYDYLTVQSTNSTTHQVCFTTPLTNSYKAAWPQYNTGSQFEVDPGGPATLYLLDPSWEMTLVMKDLTIDSGPASTTAGRSATLQNVTMTGGLCAIPSQNETINWINVTGISCVIEVDKIIGTWNTKNSTVFKIDYQSSSINLSNHDGLTAAGGAGTGGVYGSGKKLNIQNSTLDTLIVGNFGGATYGASDETICMNCMIKTGIPNSLGVGMRVNDPRIPWSMSGGMITIPLAYSLGVYEIQTKTLVPGSYQVWRGTGGVAGQWGTVFQVVSVTSDTDNTYIQTSDAGGFPTGAYASSTLNVSGHPAPKFTGSFTGGSAASARVFNGCPAQAPMYSCANLTYTGGASGTTSGYAAIMLGYLDAFTFTNNVPYTNTGSLTWSLATNGWQTMKSDFSLISFGGPTTPDGNAIINTKLSSSGGGGTRRIPSGGPATGTQAGDTVSAPTATNWFGGSAFAGPNFSANTPSDSPQVTMTLRTNQNLP
ncbi:hypothetical protein [Bradyrhizobium sp. McL0615]|uniref:hypothetical protein n=1 Tax=Bradyrhizobium sp. McL0615 TaxID=3415673 RepID=UPI003CF81385